MLSLLFAIIAAAPELLPLIDGALAIAPSLETIAAALASEGALKAFASISPTQWIPIVEEFAALAPAVKQIFVDAHPIFAQLAADLAKGLPKQEAAANVNAWFKANQPASIPGYAADGGVTDIPNPDKT